MIAKLISVRKVNTLRTFLLFKGGINMAEKEKEFEICKLAKRLTMIYIVQAKKEKKFSCFNDSDRKDFSRYLEIRFQLFINQETEPKDKAIRKPLYTASTDNP